MRLAVFARHPIQYQVPLWRLLSRTPGLDVTVYYLSDLSVRGELDPGFGINVAWDVPLLDGYRSEFISRNIKVENLSSATIPDLGSLLRDNEYDWILIQGYTCRFERQVIRSAKRLGIKVVMRGEFSDLLRRGPIKAIVRDAYLRWFYAHVDAFCYIGNDARQHLLRRRIPDGKLFFSPYCVDTTLFSAQINQFDRRSTRAELGLDEGMFAFLFSGKLIPRKEPFLLLDAIERLSRRQSVALIMLGDGPLKTQVLKCGERILGPQFLFQGFVNQSQLGRYFLAADAFVLPSNHETWGLVVNEAMQFGLPVIVSDRVGCRSDLVEEGRTGFVFSSGNSLALSACLQQLVDRPSLARELGKNASQRIASYSVRAAVDGILAAIRIQDKQ